MPTRKVSEFDEIHDAQRFRKQKTDEIIKEDKKETVTVPYLHSDILFDIFKRLPANLLQENFRYQCKQWSKLISDRVFVDSNFRQTASEEGIIFMEEVRKNIFLMQFMKFNVSGGTEIHTLNKFEVPIKIMASRNGLLLVCDASRPKFLVSTQHVINPVTKQGHQLVSIPQDVWHELVFLPSTKVYILVEMFYTDKNYFKFYEIYLRTLDGQLKHIKVPVYSLQLNYKLHWKSNNVNVVSINEILYWNYGAHGSYIVSFNVFAKKFGIIHCPIDTFYNVRKLRFIKLAKIDGSLSLVEFTPDYDGGRPVINIWKLKNISTNDWEMLYSLTGKQVSSRIQETYYPGDIIGSVNNGEIIVFKEEKDDRICTYHVKTKQWSLIENTKKSRSVDYHHVHVNSFLAPKY